MSKRLIDNFFNESEEEDIDMEDLNNDEKNELNRYKNKKDLRDVDLMKTQMEKYKHKKVSYSEWTNKDEVEDIEEEDIEEHVEDLNEELIHGEEEVGGYNKDKEQSEDYEGDHINSTTRRARDDYEKTKTQLDEEDKEYLKNISKHTPSEIQKGKNVQNQKNLFEFFIGIRIYIQKILSIVNLLPQKKALPSFFDQKTIDNYKQTLHSLYNFLISFLNTQKAILIKSNIYDKLESDTFSDIINMIESEQDNLEFNRLEDSVSILNGNILIICEKIINIWYRKTLTYTYKSNTKLLKILNNNFCEHIKTNINNNYESVRNNSRKKNPTERILGKKTASFTKETDKEIYNDDDFYNFLLKEFVSNKQDEDKTDPANRYDLTLQYIMNKNKNKKNKNVDTRASKNRKLRFDKHEKLINFMVPLVNHEINSGRNEIIKSLFGLNKAKTADIIDDNDIEII
jgi:protein AATF/BFR2